MKSYDAGRRSPPILEETIGENFERIVAANPDGEALVDMGNGVACNRRWTYAELNAEIDLIARGLISLGVQCGERVGVWSPNCAEWTIVQYATAKIGAILVNINPAYRTHELGFARDVSDRIVFMDEGRVVELDGPEALMSNPREARTRDFLRSILQQS